MNLKQTLLLTTFTLMLHGCGSNQNSYELSEEKQWEIEAKKYAETYLDVLFKDDQGIVRKKTPEEKQQQMKSIVDEYVLEKRKIAQMEKEIASTPRFEYIFDKTLKVHLPDPSCTPGAGPSYKGIVSNEFKKLSAIFGLLYQKKDFQALMKLF